jgi:hypothetical protein
MGTAKPANVGKAVDSTVAKVRELKGEAAETAKRMKEALGATTTDVVSSVVENAKNELAGLKEQLDEISKRYDQKRKIAESFSRTTAFADRFTSAGFEATFGGARESLVLRALDKLKDSEQADARETQNRIRALEETIKAKESVKVTERRI